jgi:predicted 3-demethylubiquinone-9 3-methyltransferase (glyoxalase superfamily)
MTYLEGQIKQAELYAQYWMMLAANPAADKRIIYRTDKHGVKWQFTQEELQQEAAQTALRHIQRLNDLIEKLGETK